MALCSVFVAISIVCGKYLAIRGGEVLRFSFENLPIILSGIAFGPVAGAAVGIVADLVGCLLVGYTINPIITVGGAAIGLISGILFRLLKRAPLGVSVSVAVGVSHIVGSVIIKTLGLAGFYSLPLLELMLWRLLNYVIIAVIEGMLIYALLGSKEIRRQLMIRRGEAVKMTAAEAIEYVHSISWTFCKPGLERISALCEALGNPQDSLEFIHVAGTNGKGSLSSMLDSALREAGYKVGLFTSPYILEFNERIKFNGENIPDEDLARIVERVKIHADKMQEKPTEFELITAIGFEYFKEQGCDYVILECGMGGRLDSTNIIKTPVLSVITGIALDHTAFLGDTVEKIALEKAGIIKDGIPVLFCGASQSAADIIAGVAKERGAEFLRPQGEPEIREMSLDGTTLDYLGYENVKINLLGEYQVKNARNALEALEALRSRGVKLEKRDIINGLAKAKWPARFEIINKDPLMIFDGGHNPEGVEAAVESVKRYFGDEKLYVITGVMADKDYNYIAGRISEVADRVYCLTPDNPRALKAEKYAEVFASMGVEAQSFSSVEEAVKTAIEECRAEESGASGGASDAECGKILCLGSLYMYCEVVKYL